MAGLRRAADARGKAETGITTQDRDRRSRLCKVLAQASATSMPLVAKCLRKNSKCAAVSWNCCGVSTAENTGTSVRNCTSISALITVSAMYSSSTTSPAATIAV